MRSAARITACVTCKANPSQCIVMVWYSLWKCTMAFSSSFHERSGVRREVGPAGAASHCCWLLLAPISWTGNSHQLLLLLSHSTSLKDSLILMRWGQGDGVEDNKWEKEGEGVTVKNKNREAKGRHHGEHTQRISGPWTCAASSWILSGGAQPRDVRGQAGRNRSHHHQEQSYPVPDQSFSFSCYGVQMDTSRGYPCPWMGKLWLKD